MGSRTEAAQGQARRRPYWHVDAKWVVGVVVLLVWGATLFGFGLYRVSDEKVAVPLLTTLLATSFSREGLDSAKDLSTFRKRLRTAPKQTLRPLPQVTVAIRYDEVAKLPPRETRLLIFRKLAEPLYREGADGIVRLSPHVKPKQAEQLRRDTSLISPLTRRSHESLRLPLEILGALSFVLIALLVRFSAGLGRLVSPGVVLLLAGLPGLLLLAILSAHGDHPGALAPGETVGPAYAAAELIPIAVPALMWGYLASLALGAALLVTAAAGRAVRIVTR
jgi:hypothetical protein